MTSLHLPTGPTPRQEHPTRSQAVSYVGRSKSRKFPIPDLRFEYSYLRSLRRFVHDDSEAHNVAARNNAEEKSGHDNARSTTDVGLYGVPLKIDWGWVLYLTMRDQVFSPFAQGALLAVATLYMRPLLGGLGRQVRLTWRSIFPPLESRSQSGTGWMHKQLKELGVSGAKTNIALAK